MGDHPTDVQGDILEAIREGIRARIPAAKVEASGGHYRIDIVSPVFAGKSLLESQRLVLGAIKHLINGDRPPVHAVDSLTTRTP